MPSDMPPGSIESVSKIMHTRGNLICLATFLGTAVIAGLLVFRTTQLLTLATIMGFVAGLSTLCAAVFITAINTQSTVKRREDIDRLEKSSND
jgi:hypothetical protein